MKVKHLLAGILFSFFIFIGPAFASFSSIVSFGDSLSDNGTTGTDIWGNGKYTDPYGSIWVETLATMNGATLNDYAYGGATTGLGDYVNLKNLNSQVSNSSIQNDITSYGLDYPDTLFTVWAGGNDIQYGTNPFTAASNIVNALSTLVENDAENLLVLNLPDPAMTPSIFYSTLYTDEQKTSISAWVDIFNDALISGLGNFVTDNTDTTVYFLDIAALFDEFTPGDLSWELLFWDNDGYHPSFTGHTMIAQAAANVLTGDPLAPAVPLPGAAILMASGLVGLVGLRRKRQV